MIKLVAFDWNGTLLADTNQTWVSNNFAFAAMGLKPISLRKFKETFDVPIVNLYVNNGFNKLKFLKNQKEQAKLFHTFYESRATKIRSRAGSREILRWLKKNKIEAIIYSNHTVHGINLQLKRLKLKNLFTRVVANIEMHGASEIRSKESKLCEYTKLKGYKPFEVVSIGDTSEEVDIGQAQKFHTVAITGGFHTTARLKQCHPDFLIHNMGDLVGIIKKLNS